MATVVNTLSSSQEFTIDSQMEVLVGKVAEGSATDQDRAKLAHLGANRVRLMRRSHGRRKQAA